QLLVDIADAERLERAAHATDRDIEIVEGSDRADAQRTGLRRLRVDVVEMFEARRILDVIEQRQSVSPFRCLRVGWLGEWKPLKRGSDGGNKSGLQQGAAAQAHGGLQKGGWGRHVFSRATFRDRLCLFFESSHRLARHYGRTHSHSRGWTTAHCGF